jgi:hypothetical protein
MGIRLKVGLATPEAPSISYFLEREAQREGDTGSHALCAPGMTIAQFAISRRAEQKGCL